MQKIELINDTVDSIETLESLSKKRTTDNTDCLFRSEIAVKFKENAEENFYIRVESKYHYVFTADSIEEFFSRNLPKFEHMTVSEFRGFVMGYILGDCRGNEMTEVKYHV